MPQTCWQQMGKKISARKVTFTEKDKEKQKNKQENCIVTELHKHNSFQSLLQDW